MRPGASDGSRDGEKLERHQNYRKDLGLPVKLTSWFDKLKLKSLAWMVAELGKWLVTGYMPRFICLGDRDPAEQQNSEIIRASIHFNSLLHSDIS